MPKASDLLMKISRPEFLPANSASLIIGFAWGLALPAISIWGIVLTLILAFVTITLVAAFAAQINSLSELRTGPERRKQKGTRCSHGTIQ